MMETEDVERVHARETAQATQAATLAGTLATVAVGSVSLIVGIFLDMTIAKS